MRTFGILRIEYTVSLSPQMKSSKKNTRASAKVASRVDSIRASRILAGGDFRAPSCVLRFARDYAGADIETARSVY